jgi:hypothetical protein
MRERLWARQGSNLGPRDYESPALPLSYGPLGAEPASLLASEATMGP